MNIYITRHSKTIWNEELRLQGRKDSPLTRKGILNAEALRKEIQNIPFDKVYCSPLKRASDTAKIITDKPITYDNRLLEMNFGILEGRYIKSFQGQELIQYQNLWHHPEISIPIKDGESYESIIYRAQNFIEELKTIDAHNVLIVTHGFYFNILLGCLLNYKRKDLKKLHEKVVDGCSLTKIIYSNHNFKIEYIGKNDYLPYISTEKFA